VNLLSYRHKYRQHHASTINTVRQMPRVSFHVIQEHLLSSRTKPHAWTHATRS
jgi:hypothetical protein